MSGESTTPGVFGSAKPLDDPSARSREPVTEDAFDPEGDGGSSSLGDRIRRPQTIVSFLLAGFIVLFIFTRLDIPLSDTWQKLRNANVLLFASAVGVFYATFVLRALRWRIMLSRVGIDDGHGYQMPGTLRMSRILILSWFANCVVPARLGDAYRSHLLKQQTGASFGVSIGTILAERLIDLVVLVLVLLCGGVIVFGTHAPGRAEDAFLIGAACVVVGLCGVVGLFLARSRVEQALPERFTLHFQKLHTGIFEILRRPWLFAAISVVIWIADGLRLFLVARSLGVSLTFPEANVVSLASALVTIVPFTPAGLGVVEGFMTWILPQIDVTADFAFAIAILDRLATYWSLILVGIPLYILTLRRDISAKSPTG